MPVVLLGNHAALDRGEKVDGKQVTTIVFPDTDTHSERMRTLTHDDGIWGKVAGEDPVWVASEDDRLARAIAGYFGCPVIDTVDAYGHLDVANRVADQKEDDAARAGMAGELPDAPAPTEDRVTAEVTAHVEVDGAHAAEIQGELN